METIGRYRNRREWYVAACPGCGGGILLEERGDWVTAYPESTGGWSVGHLPDTVSASWDEAIAAHDAGLNAATVVMCGRTLESAFDARGVTGGSLQQRLTQAEETGLITKEFMGAVSYARLMRNVGAHAGDSVSQDSADGVMSFTQQALRLLFEVPGELEQLTTPTEVAEGAE